jgi:integrase
MAHLIRPIKVYYVDPKRGKRVPKGTPGARKIRERARKWYGQGIPGLPPRKRVPLAADKTAAQQMLADLVRKGERGEAGLEDKVTRAQQVELLRHLDDFEASLRAGEATEKHVGQKVRGCRRVIEGCGFVTLADVSAFKVQQFLADVRARGKDLPALDPAKEEYTLADLVALLGVERTTVGSLLRRHRLGATGNGKARRYPPETAAALRERATTGKGIQTVNHLLGYFKAFCRWLVDEERLTRNPLAKLKPGNVQLDRRHDRRKLVVDELVRLLEAAKASEASFRGMAGADRHVLYLTAAGTGFRAGELASLTPGSFDLDATPPVVKLAARKGKNRKPVVHPLPGPLALVLRDYLVGRPGKALLWPGGWHDNAADMLRIDLDAAGIPYKVEGPDGSLFADFHSLRHAFCSLMDQSNLSVKQAQALARHSDPRLTVGRYSHASLTELGAAVDRLPLVGAEAAAGRVRLPDVLPAGTVEALAWAALVVLMPAVDAPRVAPEVGIAGDGSGQKGTGEVDKGADSA